MSNLAFAAGVGIAYILGILNLEKFGLSFPVAWGVSMAICLGITFIHGALTPERSPDETDN